MRRLVLPPGLVVALLLAGPPAHAQGVEAGIFGGWGFGGSLISSVGFQEVPIDSGVTYGATAAVEVACGTDGGGRMHRTHGGPGTATGTGRSWARSTSPNWGGEEPGSLGTLETRGVAVDEAGALGREAGSAAGGVTICRQVEEHHE